VVRSPEKRGWDRPDEDPKVMVLLLKILLGHLMTQTDWRPSSRDFSTSWSVTRLRRASIGWTRPRTANQLETCTCCVVNYTSNRDWGDCDFLRPSIGHRSAECGIDGCDEDSRQLYHEHCDGEMLHNSRRGGQRLYFCCQAGCSLYCQTVL
jgi:hypothetical protein